jgi:hypothetical protein
MINACPFSRSAEPARMHASKDTAEPKSNTPTPKSDFLFEPSNKSVVLSAIFWAIFIFSGVFFRGS